jgi:hypothetical protein
MSEAQIHVPADLQHVLRDFTKAVLRDMPHDVLAYSKDYFVEKAAEQRMDAYSLPPSKSKAFGELSGEMQMQVENVFKRYDEDMDGSLTIDELKTMMDDLGGLFGFSAEVDSSTLMSLLDADGNQVIDWQVCAAHSRARTHARAPSSPAWNAGAAVRSALAPPWCFRLLLSPEPRRLSRVPRAGVVAFVRGVARGHVATVVPRPPPPPRRHPLHPLARPPGRPHPSDSPPRPPPLPHGMCVCAV